jgi:urea carboxylase
VSSTTIVKADYWRLGQMKARNKLKFCRVSLADAIAKRREVEEFVSIVEACCCGRSSFEDAFPLKY